MAEGNYHKPEMNWQAADLNKEWQKFRKHVQFVFDGPLCDKSEKAKVSYLMLYVGEKGREIFETFTFSPAGDNQPEPKETLQAVFAKFEEYAAPRKNEIMLTVRFQRRKQVEGESFDNFVTDLKLLVKDCGYDNPDRMVHDAIMVGCLKVQVQEKCLDEGDALTLEKAIQIGQSQELSSQGVKDLHPDEDVKINALNRERQAGNPPGKRNTSKPSQNAQKPKPWQSQPKETTCGKCGYDASHETCPAIGSKCLFCSRKNHFAQVCRQRQRAVRSLWEEAESGTQPQETPEQYSYNAQMHIRGIYALSDANDSNAFFETVYIGDKPLRCQLDTGAKVSVLPAKHLRAVGINAQIAPTNIVLTSFSNHKLVPMGKISLETRYGDTAIPIEYYVVDIDQVPVLSGSASEGLGLLA